MDRETSITRALGAFWREIERDYPQPTYHGLSAETFNRLREAASTAVAERVDGHGETAEDVRAPFIVKSGVYGLLTREGLRQLLVDGGAVEVPEGVKFVGLRWSACATAIAELLDNSDWCEYQREKAKIWHETKRVPADRES